VGVTTLIWRKLGGEAVGFSQQDAVPGGGLAPWVTKPLVDSPEGGLTHDGGSPWLSQPSNG
jgi:hypothetical protein